MTRYVFVWLLAAAVPVCAQTSTTGMPGGLPRLDPRTMGGVPDGSATGGVMQISLRDAVRRGLERNFAIASGSADIREAHSRVTAALNALLPDVRARVSETGQQINLAAMGLPAFPGVPRVVGPFAVFDARAYASQNLFNYAAIEQRRAAKTFESAAQLQYRDLRDQVVVAVVSLYVQALTASAEAETVRAQLTTAEALYKQAVNQREAGVAIGVDVLRAQVEMQNQRQRLILARATEQRTLLSVARAIGLPAGQQIALEPVLDELPQLRTLEEYLASAAANRSDLKAAAALTRAAEQTVTAVRAERLPNVTLDGNYGTIGRSLASNHGTMQVSGGVNIPIFLGSRIRAETERAEADLARRRAEYADLQRAVDDEVRSAFLDLGAAVERFKVAQENRMLAARQLEQARDRFAAGVTNNLEVVQAQQNVAAAEEALIGSRYALHIARLAIARAAGNAEEIVEAAGKEQKQ